jgi:putative membrane protein
MLLKSLVVLVTLEHVWFMIFEMFMWKSAYARKAFGMTMEVATSSEKLAKNQGLYNGFLAAGLAWSLLVSDPVQAHSLQIFFMTCVSVAGAYGAATANVRILFFQGFPAMIALALLLF